MRTELTDVHGMPILIDLTELQTVEPVGEFTILHFRDGSKINVRERVAPTRELD